MLDIVFAILIIIACIKGYQKGLIIAVFSVVAFIIGLAAALKLSAVVAGWLSNHSNINAKWLPALSFAIVFFAVVLLVRLGAKFIEKTFQMALLGWVNRLGGIIFYAVLYLIIFSIFLFYAEKLHIVNTSTVQSSQIYPFVQPWGPVAINGFGKLVPVFKDMFTQLETFFEAAANKIPA
jgi:membrane protein required for colicin V production